jgi:bifunctional DNA-binding transcriptional regulator/antitoxin component of YhaV-PrlF toxin-antitoxin module
LVVTVTSVDSSSVVVLPKPVGDGFNLKKGNKLEMTVTEKGIYIPLVEKNKLTNIAKRHIPIKITTQVQAHCLACFEGSRLMLRAIIINSSHKHSRYALSSLYSHLMTVKMIVMIRII